MINLYEREGFTLVETIFALVILSIVGFSALNYSSNSIKNQITLENKTFAAIIANNKINEIRLSKSKYINSFNEISKIEFANQNWLIQTNFENTENKKLRKIIVKVFLDKNKVDINSNTNNSPIFFLEGLVEI